MTDSYITTTIEHGRERNVIDLPRFAKDLAKALDNLLTSVDVKLLPTTEYPNERQTIRIGKDNLNLGADNYKKRITASIAASDVTWDDRNTYDKSHRTETATVGPDGNRDIKTIARDLNRRVIDASQPALKLQREYAAKQQAGRAAIVIKANALKAKLPGLDIRTDEKAQRASIYGGSDGHYISATLNADGQVSIERIGSVSVEKFERIVAILNGGK